MEEARLWHGRGLALPLGLQASRGLPKGSPGPRRRPTGWGTGVVFLTKAGGASQALPVAGQGARVGHSAAAACAGPRVPSAGLREATVFEASGWWWILCEYMPFARGHGASVCASETQALPGC